MILMLAAGAGFCAQAAEPPPASAAQGIEALLERDERPDASETRRLAEAGALLLDVRSQDEWDAGHVKGAVFIPWQAIDDQATAQIPDKDSPIVTYCAVGVRAALAARSLRGLGYTHVTAMSGGFDDLKQAGVPAEP